MSDNNENDDWLAKDLRTAKHKQTRFRTKAIIITVSLVLLSGVGLAAGIAKVKTNSTSSSTTTPSASNTTSQSTSSKSQAAAASLATLAQKIQQEQVAGQQSSAAYQQDMALYNQDLQLAKQLGLSQSDLPTLPSLPTYTPSNTSTTYQPTYQPPQCSSQDQASLSGIGQQISQMESEISQTNNSISSEERQGRVDPSLSAVLAGQTNQLNALIAEYNSTKASYPGC